MGYFNAFCALGLCLASLGPALLSLAEQTESTLQFTGYCFMVRSVGYAAGSFAGPLYDRMPGHAIMGGSLLVAGLGTALIPAASSVYALGAIVALQGISMGTLDTGGNVMLIYLFGTEVGPWMQGLHAAFAVGAWLAPLFLRAVEGDRKPQGDGLVAQHSYDAAFYLIAAYCFAVGLAVLSMRSPRSRAAAHGEAAGAAAAALAAPAAAASTGGGDGGVQFAGALGASEGGGAGGVPLVHKGGEEERAEGVGGGDGGGAEMRVELATLDGSIATPAAAARAPASAAGGAASGGAGHQGADDDGGADADALAALDLPRETWKVVALVAGFLGLYVGAETGYGGFVTSYAVLQLGMTEADGQLVASAYWAAIMAGRFAAIYVSTLIKPGRYLVISVAGSLVSAVLLLLGAPWSELALWLGTLAFGVCMACIFPTAIAFAESAFPVVGAHATAFVVGSATGEVVLPFFIATLFGAAPAHGGGGGGGGTDAAPAVKPGTVGPVVMLWIVLVGCAGMAGMLAWLMRAAERLSRAIAVQKSRKAAAAAGAAGV